MPKPIPLTLTDFARVASSYCYVDKSALIEKLFRLPDGTSLLIYRPQGFGKSLNLSMIDDYFSYQKDNRSIFNKLAVGKRGSPKLKNVMNCYGVISLLLKETKGKTFEQFLSSLRELIRLTLKNFESLLKTNHLTLKEKEHFRAMIVEGVSANDCVSALIDLFTYLKRKTNQKVILLIDDYDETIKNATNYGYKEKIIGFLASFFEILLHDNDYLRFALFTAKEPLEKERLFASNPTFILDGPFSGVYHEYFGFSEKEVKEVLKDYQENIDIKKIYDTFGGYRFASDISYYSPASILLFALTGNYKSPERETSPFLIELLKKEPLIVSSLLINLIQKNKTYFHLKEWMNISNKEEAILSTLLGRGYLTLEKECAPKIYEITIPNETIRSSIIEEVQATLIGDGFIVYNAFVEALKDGSLSDVILTLKKLILNSLAILKEYEKRAIFYLLALSLTSLIYKEYEVNVEYLSTKGRFSILIKPRVTEQLGLAFIIKELNNNASKTRMQDEARRTCAELELNTTFKESSFKQFKNFYLIGFSQFASKIEFYAKELNSK